MNPEPYILYLEFESELDGATVYNITDPARDGPGDGQKILFSHSDYSIEFIQPLTEHYTYLDHNRKWLRSILFTTMKVSDRTGYKVPFSFPSQRDEEPVPENAIKVYSNGSGRVSGTGGWASIILMPDGKALEVSGHEKDSTSNRMELKASVKALEKAATLVQGDNRVVVLFTDSMYVINGITPRLEVWRRNGFITATGKPVVNIDLWKELAELMGKIDVRCRWIKSGSDDVFHKRCDFLAGKESGN